MGSPSSVVIAEIIESGVVRRRGRLKGGWVGKER